MGKTSLNEGNSFNGLKEIRWCYDTYIKGRKEDIVRLAKKEKIGTSQIKNCKNSAEISYGGGIVHIGNYVNITNSYNYGKLKTSYASRNSKRTI